MIIGIHDVTIIQQEKQPHSALTTSQQKSMCLNFYVNWILFLMLESVAPSTWDFPDNQKSPRCCELSEIPL